MILCSQSLSQILRMLAKVLKAIFHTNKKTVEIGRSLHLFLWQHRISPRRTDRKQRLGRLTRARMKTRSKVPDYILCLRCTMDSLVRSLYSLYQSFTDCVLVFDSLLQSLSVGFSLSQYFRYQPILISPVIS